MKNKDALWVGIGLFGALILVVALCLKSFTRVFNGIPFLFWILLVLAVVLIVVGGIYFRRRVDYDENDIDK